MEDRPDFRKSDGLIPAIAQDAATGEILMLAWMNESAWNETIKSGHAVYWSRSRSKLWKKGERSGRQQIVKEIFLDCDSDAILLKIHQIGEAACHTGRRSCFYKKLDKGSVTIVSKPIFDPQEVYKN